VKKLDIWVPHVLKEIHLTHRINACDKHLKRNEFDPFHFNGWYPPKEGYAVCLVVLEGCRIFLAASKEPND